MQDATMIALREYAETAQTLPTFAQTHAAVRLGWDDPKVTLAGLAGDWLPAGTIMLTGTLGPAKWPMGAEILPNGEVRHAAVYSVD